MGHYYGNGVCVAVDNVKGVEWYKKFAKQGHLESKNILKNNGIKWK